MLRTFLAIYKRLFILYCDSNCVKAQSYFTKFCEVSNRLKHFLALLKPHCTGLLIIGQKNKCVDAKVSRQLYCDLSNKNLNAFQLMRNCNLAFPLVILSCGSSVRFSLSLSNWHGTLEKYKKI